MNGSLLDIIKALILDFQQTPIRNSVPRHLRITPVAAKASVCIGVRRGGKSTYLFQVVKRLLDSGVAKENILYIHFFDDRLHQLRADSLSLIIDTYYSLYPEKKNTEQVYCFFDEIQAVPGWELFIDRIMRTEKCEVYLTGSSATMLSKEIATQMRGRALSWEMFPFSFREFLAARGIEVSGAMSTKQRIQVQNAFQDYWESGGFPEVIAAEGVVRVKTHQEYLHAVLFRDLIERHDIAHPRAVVDLAHWLIDNTASLYSINSLTGYLKSLGHNAPKSAVADYLDWFEDAYVLFGVRIFDASLARANRNPKKVYCIDHSFVTSVASGILVNSGHLLENLVYVALRRVTQDVRYYKTSTGREVDFIAQIPDRSRLLVQSCESLADPRTRKREVDALNIAMDELHLNTGTIVTRHDFDDIVVPSGTIIVIPIWRFLLDLPVL